MDFDYRDIFEGHPDPMWVFDRKSLRIMAVNRAALAQYGYVEDEFLALPITDLFCSTGVARSLGALGLAAVGLEAGEVWPHRRKNGTERLVEIRARHMSHQGHAATVVVVRDVSRLAEIERDVRSLPAREQSEHPDADSAHSARALQQANEKLRQGKKVLREAMRLGGMGRWEVNLEDHSATWSDEVYPIFGLTPDAFGGTFEAFLQCVHPGDREALMREIRRLIDERHPIELIYRIFRPDGELRYVRGVGDLIETNAGRVLTGIVQDITEIEISKVKALEAGSLLRMAGRTAHFGGWRMDLAGSRVTWSDETAAIHETPPGTSPSFEDGLQYFAPEDRPRIKQVFEECVRIGRPFDETAKLVTARGNRIWVRVVGEVERDPNGIIVAVHGGLQDIDELVRERAAARRLADHLHETLNNISDAFFLLDHEWRFAFVNKEAARVIDRSEAELLGGSIWALFPDVLDSTFGRQYHEAVKRRVTVSFTEYYAPLGKWFDVKAYPSPDGLAVYFTDVTARRAEQEHLRLLETALSRLNDIVIITEAEPISEPGPRIIYVNEAFVRHTGYSKAEAIGRTPRMLQGPRTQAKELARIRSALTRWEPVRAEVLNYTKDGAELWLELEIAPIADNTGWYTHWVSVERDISERKRSVEALRVSEERFRLVTMATHEVVWDWDLVARTGWWNDNLLHQFGYAPEDVESGVESWTNRIHPDDLDRVLDGIHNLIDSASPAWKDEYRFRRADGSFATVIDRGFVIRDAQGKAVRMLGSMSDVTERREMENRLHQSQKLEALGQLTGGIAHDFNNLLTVILGNAEILADRLADDEPLRRLAEMSMTAAARGAKLTGRLLTFSRRQTLAPKAIDINRLVVGMEELLRRTISETIDIKIICGDGVWKALVDAGQLEMAVLNLAINARDAMRDGGHLTIETANVALDETYAAFETDISPGEYVMLSIADTGAGMLPDIASKAFEPFFTTKEMGKGTGLGLSMVYGFVKQSSGHVTIYSEPGQGTIVRLYLPRMQGSSTGSGAETAIDAATFVSANREKILVVEDDELVLAHVARLIAGLGYRIVIAKNGLDALARLEEHPDVDLLFTDVVMPGGMNGRELADRVRCSHPDLPVLFTSGYTQNALTHNRMRLDPGIELLSKPYRRQELAAKLRTVLDGRR